MEIKCSICGTINDGSTNFCKGCFQKLDVDRSNKIDNSITSNEPVIDVPIEEEKEEIVPWMDDSEPIGISEQIEPIPLEVINPIEEDNSDFTSEVVEIKPMVEQIEELSNDTIQDEILEEINDNQNDISQEEIVSENEDILEDINNDETNIEPVPLLDDWSLVDEELENNEIKVATNLEVQNNLEENIEVINIESPSDDWSIETPEKEEIKPKFKLFKPILEFLGVYVALLILFFTVIYFANRYIPLLNTGEDAFAFQVILYSIGTLLSTLLTTIIIYKKIDIPNEYTNKVSYLTLSLIVIPSLLFELYYLVAFLTNSVLLFIIGLIISIVIVNIFFSFIRTTIRKKNNITSEDKGLFRFGVISIVIAIILLIFGLYAKKNNLVMPNLPFSNYSTSIVNVEDVVYGFIEQTEKTILRLQTENPDYVIPNSLIDVSYAVYNNYTPDSMQLVINDLGVVSSGIITYSGTAYVYDGETIKAG